jgi:hypothetical protein
MIVIPFQDGKLLGDLTVLLSLASKNDRFNEDNLFAKQPNFFTALLDIWQVGKVLADISGYVGLLS